MSAKNKISTESRITDFLLHNETASNIMYIVYTFGSVPEQYFSRKHIYHILGVKKSQKIDDALKLLCDYGFLEMVTKQKTMPVNCNTIILPSEEKKRVYYNYNLFKGTLLTFYLDREGPLDCTTVYRPISRWIDYLLNNKESLNDNQRLYIARLFIKERLFNPQIYDKDKEFKFPYNSVNIIKKIVDTALFNYLCLCYAHNIFGENFSSAKEYHNNKILSAVMRDDVKATDYEITVFEPIRTTIQKYAICNLPKGKYSISFITEGLSPSINISIDELLDIIIKLHKLRVIKENGELYSEIIEKITINSRFWDSLNLSKSTSKS